MLFDPRPKTCREDLFDREEEIKELKEAVSKYPLTLLLGIRRIGKTSILRVALDELEVPYAYLDLRILEEEGFSRASLYRLLSEALTNTLSKWGKLVEYLKIIKGVEVRSLDIGFNVEFNWREKSLSITRILSELNRFAEKYSDKGFFVVALDEAQLLRYLSGGKGRIDFRTVLAYAYDNLPNLRLILTGSEAGLLLGMLKLDDSSSPIYGRFVKVIRLNRFDREKSLAFLRKGFEEAGVEVSEDALHRIYERVDGVVGWLTYFGALILESRSHSIDSEVVEEVAEKALKLVEKELSEVFKRSKHYMYVLKAISIGVNTWSGIKKAVEAWLGKSLENPAITRLLKNLVELDIVEKRNNHYVITDPLILEYCKRL